MLRELVRSTHHQAEKVTTASGANMASHIFFLNAVNFLADRQFPNIGIRRRAKMFKELIKTKDVVISSRVTRSNPSFAQISITGPEVESVEFAESMKQFIHFLPEEVVYGLVSIPITFIGLAINNLPAALEAVIEIISKACDFSHGFYANHDDNQSPLSNGVESRSLAFQAEMLWTLVQMANYEGIVLNVSKAQSDKILGRNEYVRQCRHYQYEVNPLRAASDNN